MICKKCGSQIDDGAAFCPVCGEAAQTSETIVLDAKPTVNPIMVMVMGIIALATCEAGIFGIIFGAIANAKANAYIRSGAPMVVPVRLGKIFGKVGLILGIIWTIFWVVLFAIIIIAAILGVELAM